jgi:hypothetical protein
LVLGVLSFVFVFVFLLIRQQEIVKAKDSIWMML